jgi:hypothetical protein
VPRGTVSLTLSQPHDPSAFYQNRPGLYIWDSFSEWIVAYAKPIEAGNAYQLAVSQLAEAATDAQIEESLAKNHLFDQSAVCAIMAEMISKQSNGEDGDLINSGDVNLFYTAYCVALVSWHRAYRRWRVFTWSRDAGRWLTDSRVFSPA